MPQKTSGSLTPALAVLAVLATAGLFYALFVLSEPTEIAVAEEEERDPALPLGLNVFLTELDEERLDAQTRVELSDILVESVLGSTFFTFMAAEEREFLVYLQADLAATGVQVESGDVVEVKGRVYPLTDNSLEDWELSGQIPEGIRDQFADFEWYFLADDLQIEVPEVMLDDDDGDEGDESPASND